MADSLGMPLTTLLDYLRAMSAAGHLQRLPHPGDGRAVQLRLSSRGLTAHRRAHDRFEVVYQEIIDRLDIPVDRLRVALAALDSAVQTVGGHPVKPR
jgi:DNA-binding MarR family transcriptional regulator